MPLIIINLFVLCYRIYAEPHAPSIGLQAIPDSLKTMFADLWQMPSLSRLLKDKIELGRLSEVLTVSC